MAMSRRPKDFKVFAPQRSILEHSVSRLDNYAWWSPQNEQV
jgi:hypothetical protein